MTLLYHILIRKAAMQLHSAFNDLSQNTTLAQIPYPENATQNNQNIPRLSLIAGDASDRKFYRLLNSQTKAICMRFPKWEGGYGGDPLSWLGMQHALSSIGIPVPKILCINQERECIWTEDFGDQFLNYKLENNILDKNNPATRETLEYYDESLTYLVRAQYPQKENPIPPHPAQKLAFDFEKLMFEMRFFTTHFLNGFLGFKIDARKTFWKNIFFDLRSLCEFLGHCERVLCHRDYHVRNVMISENKVKWIDFQDARMGPHTYDVVSLIRDSYVNITQDTRNYLSDLYFSKLTEARKSLSLSPIDKEDYLREFLYMGVQRNIKAIGSFGYLATLKNKSSYLKYILPTLQTLLHPQYATSDIANLSNIFPALFDFLSELYRGKFREVLDSNLDIFIKPDSARVTQ